MKYQLTLILVLVMMSLNAQEIHPKKILEPALIKELKELFKKDQKNRKLVNNSTELSKAEKAYLRDSQKPIDRENIRRLLEIIEEHGYVDAYNSNAETPTFIMFAHTPPELCDEVYKVIKEENAKGRVAKEAFGFMKWHLEGRNEEPAILTYTKKHDSIN